MDTQTLRSQLYGRVHRPGDDDYQAEYGRWNLPGQYRPAVIAIPETAADVAVSGIASGAAPITPNHHGMEVTRRSFDGE